MTSIGTLYGRDTSISGMSADGRVVVGSSPITNNRAAAFVWTASGGMVDLGTLPGGNAAYATGVNADGTVIVGTSNAPGASFAVSWVNGAISNLGSLGGTYGIAQDVSANGSVIVGYSYIAGDAYAHAFRWVNGTMTDLGTIGGGNSYAQKVSADGSTVIGQSDSIGFRWNGGTMIPLLLPGGSSSEVAALTPDGSTVIGSSDDGNGNFHAYRWKNGAVTDLTPTETSPYVFAKGVSNNGEVVVGYSGIGASLVNTRAWRWTAATGNVALNTLLANAGVNMTGINLRQANAISGDGQYIVGMGVFGGASQAYLLRYDDGAGRYNDGAGAIIAGVTTLDAQQQSVTSLSNQRSGMAAQHHGLAGPLLGGDRPTSAGGEAGVFASGGSASAGGTVRYTSSNGFSILGGAAWAREDYVNTELRNSWIGAGAFQYIHDGFGSAVRPLIEVGGWITPNASLSFNRTYANGAGTATGTGNTKGDLSYIYGRAGVVFSGDHSTQIILSGEYGRQQLKTAAYSEQLAGNPFNAVVSGGTDAMDVVKLRLQGSRDFGRFDATVWAAWAGGFNRTATYVTSVAGAGALSPSALGNIAWGEYGVRVGYKVSKNLTADVFANGISGGADLGTRVHGGAGLRVRF